MKTFRFPFIRRAALVGVAFFFGGLPVGALAQRTALTVQAGQPGRAISPDLLGVFFEDINYAADGGLYAELVQNRSFEYDATEQLDWNAFSFWKAEKRGEGAGALAIKSARPIHRNNPHYAMVTVETPGEGFGLVNGGYEGIPVKGGEAYSASFFACQLFMDAAWGPDNSIEGRPMPVTLRLESKEGELLAEASLAVVGRDWKRLAATLTPTRTENAARLVILAKAKGAIGLDEISLFPAKTFRNRPNGLRADIAQAIADIHPRFIRFPGGCVAHGDGLSNIYRWKDTIGPVEQRKGQRNLWGYHQSVGLGYFEYFQYCEDIGAAPLPVLAAGVCCQFGSGSPHHGQEGLSADETRAFIQDVLDLIEWANGPVTSKWGAERAAAGHPAPFGLKYLGLGNEDAITPLFESQFQLIYAAVKAKYPDIVVVGTVGAGPDGKDFERGWAFAKQLNLPTVDEHYYVPPQWFWDNLHRYDGYDRTGPKVYAGEYAAHEKSRRNTLRSALAEAAVLTSFERNGDVVHLASYAPLLARRGHSQWTPDLIYFSGTEVFLTANYYVQQLFGQNSGDTALETTLGNPPRPATLAASSVRDGKSGDLILKIVNGAGAAAPLSVQVAGLKEGRYKATKTVLTAPDAEAVNEDHAPAVVQPVSAEITLAPSFDYEAPADSLTVFRLRQPALQP